MGAPLLVVLLEIDPESRSVVPFESDAPRTIHVDRVPLRPSMKGMEIKAGLIQLSLGRRRMQSVQANQDPSVQ
jgi:hypothetical protein